MSNSAFQKSSIATPVSVLNGGTGATTASGARTNLGVAIGTNVEAWDADLDAFAGLSTTGIVVRTGSGTAATRTITGTASRLSVSNGDGVSANPTLDIDAAYVGQASITTLGTITTGTWTGTTIAVANGGTGATTASGARTNLGVAIGSNVQAWDATLDSFAAYNTNGLLTQTAADTFTGRTITGTASRLSVSNGNGVAGNPTIDIDAAYVGQSSITTLGTVTTGVWNGTTIAVANGGTGATTASGARTNLSVPAISEIQSGTFVYAADGGGTDAYAISLSPALGSYTTGMTIAFKANTANTGAASLNVNSLGAITIKKLHDQDLATGDIESGQIILVSYDGTNFQMQSQVSSSSSGGTYATGQASRSSGAGTGTQDITHGLGVTPKLVMINYSGTFTASNAAITHGTGTCTTTSDYTCTYSQDGTSDTGASQENQIIVVRSSSGAGGFIATVSTLDSTKITLNFTTNAGSGNVGWQWSAFA